MSGPGKSSKQRIDEIANLGVPQIEQSIYASMARDLPLTQEEEERCDDVIAAACAHIRALRPLSNTGSLSRDSTVYEPRMYRQADARGFTWEAM